LAVKIAVYYNLPSGGAKRSLYDQIRGLLELGNEVSVWHSPHGDDAEPRIGALTTAHAVPGDDAPPPWWSGGRAGGLRSPRVAINRAVAQAKAAAQSMNANGADVHYVATDQIFGSPAVGRFLQRPSVLYLQEPHRWLYEANPEFPWLAAPPSAPVPRKVLELLRIARRSQRARFEVDNAAAFDALLVNSHFSSETVSRIYGLSSSVCYLGVETSTFRRTHAAREHMVAGVGNFVRQKHGRALVDAVGRIAADRPRIEWVAASVDEAYEREVRQVADASGIEFVIHRAASDAQLVDVLNRARAVVYTPRLEPFGLVPLEANACGAPVIGIAEGGVRETVIDQVNGLLVDDLEDGLARGIERVLRDPELAARLGEEGERIVKERWTTAAATARLDAHLQAVASGRRKPQPRTWAG
jgi:glycosyltransferase involved in cell wall biosynthesis